MHLPAGFEHRATTIARLVGGTLAKQSISAHTTLESVVVKPPRISASTRDDEIAAAIVMQIISSLRGGR
jgi:hypothetical protein